MATREPWECPRCHRILAPHMDFCDCGGTAEVGAVPLTSVPPGNTGITPPWRITGTAWPSGGSTSTTWEGVTITGHSAA
jgi:hypothetical protein